MRHPVGIKQSGSENHGTIGQWFVRIAVFYSALSLLLLGSVAVEIKLLDPEIDAMKLIGAIGMLGMHDPAGASGALAPASPRDPGSVDSGDVARASAWQRELRQRDVCNRYPTGFPPSVVRDRRLLSDCRPD